MKILSFKLHKIIFLFVILFTSNLFAYNEFMVNQYNQYFQEDPEIASDSAGNFVVVWTNEEDSTGNYVDVYARRFDKYGNPLTNEFIVNFYTNSAQGAPSIAMDPVGNFIVSWYTVTWSDGSSYNIIARRFDKDCNPLGSDFLVNTYTDGYQAFPSAAMDDAGNFVIAWQGDDESFYARRFDNNGNPLGSEFQVNTTSDPGSYSMAPSVAMDSNGDFVITWSILGDIYAQLFDYNGDKVGNEFKVNIYQTYSQLNPSAEMDSEGNFVITWQSYREFTSGEDVVARMYDKNGNPLSGDLQVSLNGGVYPSIAMDNGGNFIITYCHSLYIYAQKFLSDGTKYGGEFKVTTNTGYLYDDYPDIAMNGFDDYTVTWERDYQPDYIRPPT
jgi:hypothetical protein